MKLQLKNITKKFNDVIAVDNINLEVEKNEFIVLLGASGCGKTTTLRLIAGLEDLTKGEIYIDDKLVNDKKPKDRDIAMVFQNYALYPHLTVYENMAFGLRLRKYPKQEIDKRVKTTADTLQIGELLHRKPKELSGGQKQRVALGRAIIRKPTLSLFDEPLSNLDAKLRIEMRAEIIKIYKGFEEPTVIYVTHDQVEAMTMATKICVMDKGKIVQIGTPDDIYNNPVNMMVAGFIGTPAMNFIEKEDVIIGVRPEDVIIAKESPKLNVVLVEKLGDSENAYMEGNGKIIVSKIKGLKVGDRIGIEFKEDKIFKFDKVTKLRI